MNELSTGKPIHYCYSCGTRLRPTVERCWYCGAPVQREIRAPRRCPFCAEPIRPESIKCRHCGEFVDGRARTETRPVNQVIVIDKDLLKTMSDLQLVPGQPIPDVARQILDERTVRAIEESELEEIQQPGVRVLPAPPPPSSKMIEYRPTQTGSSEIVHVPKTQPPVVRGPFGEPPVPGAPSAQPPARQTGPVGTPLPRAAESGAPRRETPAVVDAEVEEFYRICDMCRTEILATDNFCYYCGKKHRRTHVDKRREAIQRRRKFYQSVKALFLFALIAAVAAGAYLYLTGRLSKDRIKDLGQSVRKTITEKLGIGIGELKNIHPKEILAAEKCRKNLRRIESAKNAAAEKRGLKSGIVPLDVVLKELGTTQLPACPSNGAYTLNPIGQPPTCSMGDNGTTSTLDDHVIQDEQPKGATIPAVGRDPIKGTTDN